MPKVPSGKKCMVGGCEGMVKANDLCAMHYARSLRHGSTEDARRHRGACTVDGCDRLTVAKGLCQMHYYRMQRSGTTDDPARAAALICTVDGCDKPHVAQGLCQMHYARMARHGDVVQTRDADWGAREKHPLYRLWNSQMRYKRSITDPRWHDLWAFVEDLGNSRPAPDYILARLDEDKPFGPENIYWREPRRSGNSEQKKADARGYMRQWRQTNLRDVLGGELRKKYGIGMDDYDRMLDQQDGVCAICRNEETRVDHRTKKVSRLAVDHCHKTGAVRALLCHSCNGGLGRFSDNAGRLRAAAAYLERHAAPPAPAERDPKRDYLTLVPMPSEWPPVGLFSSDADTLAFTGGGVPPPHLN
jgi:hypothetical protein